MLVPGVPMAAAVTVPGTSVGLNLAVLVVVAVPMAAELLTSTTKLTVCVTFWPSEATTVFSAPPTTWKSMPAGSPPAPSPSAVPGALLHTAEPAT